MQKSKNLLWQRDFTLMVVGQMISLFGNAILRFALPLYLLRETGSAALFGLVTACSFLPLIVFSLLGGILADRVNKRNIMVLLDFCTGITVLTFLLLHDQMALVPLIILTLMILYSISGVYQPSVQASIPALLPDGKIVAGNAVINIVNTLAGLLGPALGGIAFGLWGITPILLIGIVAFLTSAALELFLRIPCAQGNTEIGIMAILKNDLGESWHFIRYEKPSFISVVIVLAAFNLALSSVLIVGIPLMVVNILGLSDAHLGFTQAALGLGGLTGGALAGVIASRLKLGNSYWLLLVCGLAAALMGVGLLDMVPVFLGYILITAMSFTAMAASTIFTVIMSAVVQRQTPLHLVGKIMAVIISLSMCFQPLGQAMYGVLFDILDRIPWLVLLGASIAAVCISLYSRRAFSELEVEDNSPGTGP